MDVVALTRELVDFPSVSGEEGPLAVMLAQRLEKEGWRTQLQPVPPERAGGPERFNLLALADPSRPVELVLTTHLDTVPPFIPSSEDAEHVYGRGSCDAKGIFAAQWAAIERLRQRGLPGLALLGVAGEETDSLGAKAVHAILPRARFIIDGEPTDLRMTSGAKGILSLKLSVRGVAGHSAYPERGRSAAHILVRALARLLDSELPARAAFGDTTVNVGRLETGVAPNVIAPSAEALVLIRLAAPVEEVQARVMALLGEAVEVAVTSASEPLAIHVPAGHVGEVVRFGSDVPYLSKLGTTLLVGPGSIFDAHTAGERIAKKELLAAVDMYEALGSQLLEGGRA